MIRPSSREELISLLPTGLRWAEIGVLRGDFSQSILDIAEPSHLHLVDIWAGQYAWTNEAGAEIVLDCDTCLHRVTSRFLGRPDVSIWRTQSSRYFAAARQNSLDVVYLDGHHGYRVVQGDLSGALFAVRPGGWILGHDYCTGDVVMPGVRKAVDEFLETHRLQFWALTDEPLQPVIGPPIDGMPDAIAYNSFAIQVPE